MSSKPKTARAESGPSLDRTLHQIQTKIAPTRLAALQILIHHMEMSNAQNGNMSVDDFWDAKTKLNEGYDAARGVRACFLATHDLQIPDRLGEMLDEVVAALGEIVSMTARCTVADGKIKGFHPLNNMYDLCCTRVAKGVNAFSDALRMFFLELSEKGKADALDRTSDIATEIGKIGRVINMVATNASIEVPRAGDAGKGFTVIADEVKVLSSRVSSLSVSLTDRLHVN